MRVITSEALAAGALTSVVDCLRSGGLVAFPTDTLYGLGADASDDKAIRRLYKAKNRPVDDPLPILLSDPREARQVTLRMSDLALKLASRFWPGALTLVLPRSPAFHSLALAGRDGVALRVPAHDVPRLLIEMLGRPITGTSANISGLPPPTTAQEVAEQLGKRIDIVIDGGRTPIGVESTVIDLVGEVPRLLREGAITRAQIEAVVGRVD